jgi:hypothetical protein
MNSIAPVKAQILVPPVLSGVLIQMVVVILGLLIKVDVNVLLVFADARRHTTRTMSAKSKLIWTNPTMKDS